MSYPPSASHDELPPTGPGSRKRRRWFLGVSGVLLLVALWVFREVLVPFMLAIILAYVFAPVVQAGEQLRIRGRNPPRWTVVLVLYTVVISGLIAIAAATIPRLSAEFSRLASDAPRLAAQVRMHILPEIERRLSAATSLYRAELREGEGSEEVEPRPSEAQLRPPPPSTTPREPEANPPAILFRPLPNGAYEVVLPDDGLRVGRDSESGGFTIRSRKPRKEESAQDITAALTSAIKGAIANTEQGTVTLIQTAQQIIATLARGIFGFVMMFMISAYMLVSSDRIFDFFRSLYPPRRRGQFEDLVRRIDRGLAGVVRGQLMISLVNGVLSGIGFFIFGLKYWVFLTLLATVMSVIPIFGSILSTIPALLVALPQGVGVSLLVLTWIVGIHQIEANLLNPKIMGDAARVHPVLVVFALLAGEHLAGISGAIFAVPILSVTQTLFLFLREHYLGVPRSSIPPSNPSTSGRPSTHVQAQPAGELGPTRDLAASTAPRSE